jgi:hypothetical protein
MKKCAKHSTFCGTEIRNIQIFLTTSQISVLSSHDFYSSEHGVDKYGKQEEFEA